jgi:hypothetical protein
MQRKNNLLSLITNFDMKPIFFLISFCFISILCFGQHKVEPELSKADTAFFNNIKHFQLNLTNEILVNKIIILPVDNMPCLVANEKLLASIPNATVKNKQVNNIPNPLKKD